MNSDQNNKFNIFPGVQQYGTRRANSNMQSGIQQHGSNNQNAQSGKVIVFLKFTHFKLKELN